MALKRFKSEDKTIIVTGTPGTGKSRIAKKLSLSLKRKLISTTLFAKKHGLFGKYDTVRKTYIIDSDRLSRLLVKEIEENRGKGLVIEGHMSHFLPSKMVRCCVVCKTELKKLEKRLKKREYSSIKIRENLDCEIFDVCLNEAIENGHKVLILDTSGKVKETDEKLKRLEKKL